MMTLPRLIRWLLQVGLVAVFGSSGWAAAQQRYPVTAEQAAAAMAARGVPVTASEISLPMHMTSASAAPVLEAGKVEHSGDQMRVRLACADHADCLPFYVTILETASEPMLARAAAGRVPVSQSAEPSLRAGARATLAIDDNHLHIRVPVVCLDPGQPGATIRVRSLDHKQTWQAEVIDQTLVRGSL